MKKQIRHYVLNKLDEAGWEINKKEWINVFDKKFLLTLGGFGQGHDKDDSWIFVLSRFHSNILDIGCNIGQSAFLMAIDRNSNLVCVDPNPRAIARCAENLIVNGLSNNCKFINAFVGDENDKEVEFYSSLTDEAGSMFKSFAKTSSSIGKSRMVKLLTVDRICENSGLLPDLIKIDVEGAEFLVLKGINLILQKVRPKLFIEVHSGEELSIIKNTEDLMSWAKENKYKCYYLRDHSLLTSSEQIKNRGKFHMIMIDENQDYPDYLKGVSENDKLSELNKKHNGK